MKYIIFFLLLVPLTAYAEITINNGQFSFQDFDLYVTTPVVIDSFVQNGTGFTTNHGEDLRYYQFGNNTGGPFNIRWIEHTDTYANFTITSLGTSNVVGNVTGTELDHVEIDQVDTPFSYTTLNFVDIDTGVLVEYFFPAPIIELPPPFNAIVLSLNSPTETRLGGVFAVICPTNSTLTGLLTNGTFVCTPMSDFFP